MIGRQADRQIGETPQTQRSMPTNPDYLDTMIELETFW